MHPHPSTEEEHKDNAFKQTKSGRKRLRSRVDETDVSIIIQFSLPEISKANKEKKRN